MSEKGYVSVISEYNPFHFGHAYQLNRLSEEFDGIVCIMSGDLVQRGSVAVADKYLRAAAAVKSGANLVAELPIPWCCSSARDFARAGVHIASSFGCTHLAFGTEDELSVLERISEFISDASFPELLSEASAKNKALSYPRLFRTVISEKFGEEFASAVSKPNNILALEYLSALKEKEMKPFAVRRESAFPSSSEIRKTGDGEKMLSMLPDASREVFAKALLSDFPRDESRLNSFFVGSLRRMSVLPVPKNIYSVPEDLARTIFAASRRVNTLDGLVEACVNKIYTSARVRRAVLALTFGITEEMVHARPPYTTVLALDSVGRKILSNAKKHSETDIITKPVHALSKSERTKNAFLFSKSAEDIISLSSPTLRPADAGRTPFVR